MRLIVRKSDYTSDWYVIERAEHDGRQWIEKTDQNVMSLRCSSRFSDADVEGPAAEMLEIADAIEKRGKVSFRRCAVRVDAAASVAFWSPRNSQEDGLVTLAEADDLAKEIRRKCASKDRP